MSTPDDTPRKETPADSSNPASAPPARAQRGEAERSQQLEAERSQQLEAERSSLDTWGWVFVVLGVGSIANALWMLAGPMHWYTDLPAAVPDTGPFNPHFVRDIGCAFLTVGVALVWAAFDRRNRAPLAAIAALFMVAHGVLHMYDTLRGALGHNHWWLDLPGVYLPAIVLAIGAFLVRRPATD